MSFIRNHWFKFAVVAAFGAMVGPSTYDYLRGAPKAENQLTLKLTSEGQVTVEDRTFFSQTVIGARTITLQDESERVICSRQHAGIFNGERVRQWNFYSLTGCSQPEQPFIMCSRFDVRDGSRRDWSFGPFCTPLTQPFEQRRNP